MSNNGFPALSPAQFKPGTSPFDAIMHKDKDGTEWWSARELMVKLGYTQWHNMEKAIERAQLSCGNMGVDVASNFTDGIKVSGGGRRGPSQSDVRLTRYACYILSINGDPIKPEVAAAQAYFVIQTRIAETRGPVIKPWSERITTTVVPHMREVYINHPNGFTVMTTLSNAVLFLEDELVRHMFAVSPNDRPDVSLGLHWATYRRYQGLPDSKRSAPLWLEEQGINVYLKVYDNIERGPCETWFHGVYLPEHLPNYLHRKPEFRKYGELPQASAADNVCRKLSGREANIRPKLRGQLTRAGGFVPAGKCLEEIPGEQRMLFG